MGEGSLKKILWCGVLLVIFSWVGNYFYFHSKQIERPIFLEHYYESMNHETLQFTFYYLTNKSDPKEVHYVEIDNVVAYPMSDPGFQIWHGTEPQIQYEQAFRHQYLMAVTIQFPAMEREFIDQQNEPWSFHTMDVYFDDQSIMAADIGEVIIRPLDDSNNFFDFQAGGSGNDHRSFTTLSATEDATIENMSIPFPHVRDNIEVKLDHRSQQADKTTATSTSTSVHRSLQTDWDDVSGDVVSEGMFPLQVKENDVIHLSTLINSDQRNYLEFGIYLEGTTADGQPFKSGDTIIDRPYLNQVEVNEIIKERQGSS